MTERDDYVKKYYQQYDSGDGLQELGEEIEIVGKFLVENTHGVILDAGCGPAPQIRALLMPYATEIHAIDLPAESIEFVTHMLQTKDAWYERFGLYQAFVEQVVGEKLQESYLVEQIDKVKSIVQADMTKPLPFEKNSFDTVISLYSLGTLKNEGELENAIMHLSQALKPGGVFLHINTNGQNTNTALPEYTWQGLPQTSNLITHYLKKYRFHTIEEKNHKINDGGMYKYDAISMIKAVK